jgi:hypothetical protein
MQPLLTTMALNCDILDASQSICNYYIHTCLEMYIFPYIRTQSSCRNDVPIFQLDVVYTVLLSVLACKAVYALLI